MKRRDGGILAVVLLLSASFPFFSGGFALHVIITTLIYAIVALNWNVLLGFVGVYSFGQVAFFGIGAYAYAILLLWFGMPVWVAFLLSGAIVALFGLFIGSLTLRMGGIYLALFTVAFHELVRTTVTQYIALGGVIGISIPAYPQYNFWIGPLQISSYLRTGYYYLTLVIFLISTFILYMVVKSRYGTAFRCIGENKKLAEGIGIPIYKYKLLAFLLTSYFTGMAGALVCNYTGVAAPSFIDWWLMIPFLIMLYMGGVGDFFGPLIGVFIINFMNTYLLSWGILRFALMGVMLLLVTLFMPGGLISIFRKILKRARSVWEQDPKVSDLQKTQQ